MFVLGITVGQVSGCLVAAAISRDPRWLAVAGSCTLGYFLIRLGGHIRLRRTQRADPFADVVGLIDNRTPRFADFDALDWHLRQPINTRARLAAAHARHRDRCQPDPAERLAWAELHGRLESESDGGVPA